MSKPNIPEGGFKHTMLDPQFGKLVPDDFPDERDAIHIATAAVFALEDLKPGDHVGLTSEKPDWMGKSDIAPLGIVDPFLTEKVKNQSSSPKKSLTLTGFQRSKSSSSEG